MASPVTNFLSRWRPAGSGLRLLAIHNGYRLWLGLVGFNGHVPRLVACVESHNIDTGAAIAEAKKQLASDTGQKLPRQVVLVTNAAIAALLDLPVQPDKTRSDDEMSSMISWELEAHLEDNNDLYNLGAILAGRGLVTQHQRHDIAVELETRRVRGNGLARYGEVAVDLGLIDNDQLNESLLLQERLVVSNAKLACGWQLQTLAREDKTDHLWLCTGLDSGLRSQWHRAFAQNGLKLTGILPLAGAAAPLAAMNSEHGNAVVVEAHQDFFAIYRLENFAFASFHLQPRLANQALEDQVHGVAVEQLRVDTDVVWLVDVVAEQSHAASAEDVLDLAATGLADADDVANDTSVIASSSPSSPEVAPEHSNSIPDALSNTPISGDPLSHDFSLYSGVAPEDAWAKGEPEEVEEVEASGLGDSAVVGGDDSVRRLSDRLEREVRWLIAPEDSAEPDIADAVLAVLYGAALAGHKHALFAADQGKVQLSVLPSREPPPPVWKNSEVYRYGIPVLLAVGIIGHGGYSIWHRNNLQDQLDSLNIEYNKRVKLNKQLSGLSSEASKKTSQLDTLVKETENLTAQVEKLSEKVIRRGRMLPPLMQSIARSVTSNIMLDSVVEPRSDSRNRFNVTAWATDNASASEFSERLQAMVARFNYRVADTDIKSGIGRYGLNGYTIDLWLVPIAKNVKKPSGKPVVPALSVSKQASLSNE